MVTHPEMQRYFMTIPEASQLVLQAGAMGDGGEIYVLDMGEPVKIVDLARDLITLSGLRPGEDIEIKFNGIRPGEKLFEQLTTDAEHADKTKHPKIFIGRVASPGWSEAVRGIDNLLALVDGGNPDRIRLALHGLVPEYSGAGALVVEAAAEPPPPPGAALDRHELPTSRRSDGTGPEPALAVHG
jgi:FlaA1/EpsC-like NDP-sugar epimerase